MSIFIGFLLVSLASCAYTLFRNACVFSYRMKVLEQCRQDGSLDAYSKLPSYDAMMLRFWVWPLSKFENYQVKGQQQHIKLVK